LESGLFNGLHAIQIKFFSPLTPLAKRAGDLPSSLSIGV
jgi:hypothetical protein